MSKRPKIILQARPRGELPAVWPVAYDGWVSVAPDGSGWTAGLDLDCAFAARKAHVAELCEVMQEAGESDDDDVPAPPREFDFRIVEISVLPVTLSKRAPTRKRA